MGYLHPDKLLNVRHALEKPRKKRKRRTLPHYTNDAPSKSGARRGKRSRVQEDKAAGSDLIRALAYQIGAERARRAKVPTRGR